jgi:MFS family permease
VKYFLGIFGALILLSVPAAAMVAPMSLMSFDAPGSEGNPIAWLMVACCFAYPLFALIGPILSWISFRKGRRRLSVVFMTMPVVPITVILLVFAIGHMFALADGAGR